MITRRRTLCILAGSAILPLLGQSAGANTRQWSGIALGAKARIILDHKDAKTLIARAISEIERLEQIFSLYRSDSQLSVLNREGQLFNPSFDLIQLLTVCSSLNARTKGVFDPTIQALWSLYAREYAAGRTPDANDIASARKMIGWNYIEFSQEKIFFHRPGVALTLNGIAQGFIADKIAQLLRAEGVSNVLIDTGEIAALGTAPDGGHWSVKLKGYKDRTVNLSNAAIATSARLGTVFDTGGTAGHILDPRSGVSKGKWSTVSVISQSAAESDGLSTAFCVMKEDEISASKGTSRVWLDGMPFSSMKTPASLSPLTWSSASGSLSLGMPK